MTFFSFSRAVNLTSLTSGRKYSTRVSI